MGAPAPAAPLRQWGRGGSLHAEPAEQAAAEITPGKRGGGSGKKNKREATRFDHKGRQVADGSSEEDEARARKQLKALARADCANG